MNKNESVIVIKNLTKKYKKRTEKKKRKKEEITAVSKLNLNIKKGEILGLIGPNGAGKTTTLKMLSNLILPDEGSASIYGYDIVKDSDRVKNKIGLLSGEFARSLYWRLTGRQNIEFFAKLKNLWDAEERIDELFELFNLKKWQNDLIMKYSTGMKHKLAFAVGLLKDPSVLFLDEPLTGMDPLSCHEIKKLIKTKFKDKTIIWASHNLYEIEEMCDKIALINNGKIVLYGKPEELKKKFWDYEKIVLVVDKADEFKSMKEAKIDGRRIELKTKNVNDSISEIQKFTKKHNIKIIEVKTLKPSLEDIFIKGVKNC